MYITTKIWGADTHKPVLKTQQNFPKNTKNPAMALAHSKMTLKPCKSHL